MLLSKSRMSEIKNDIQTIESFIAFHKELFNIHLDAEIVEVMLSTNRISIKVIYPDDSDAVYYSMTYNQFYVIYNKFYANEVLYAV